MSAWDWQLIRIYERGFIAFQEGKKREECPYRWAKCGFGRQRYDYWNQGFDEAATIASDQRLFERARAEALKKQKR